MVTYFSARFLVRKGEKNTASAEGASEEKRRFLPKKSPKFAIIYAALKSMTQIYTLGLLPHNL